MSTFQRSAYGVGLPVSQRLRLRAPVLPQGRHRALARTLQHVLPLVVLDTAAAATAGALVLMAVSGTPRSLELLVVLEVLWLAALRSCGAYDRNGNRPAAGTAQRVLRAGIRLVVGLAAATYLLNLAAPVSELVVLVGATVALTLALRLLVGWDLAGHARPWRVVVAGHHGEVGSVVNELCRMGDRIEVAAVSIADDRAGVVSSVARHGADALVVMPCRHFNATTLRGIGWDLDALGSELMVVSGLVDVAEHRVATTALGSLRVLHVRPPGASAAGRFVKHCWERVAAGAALLALAPVLLALMLLVRRESHGPAIFRQTRIGRDQKPFTMYKLRTMTCGAEHQIEDLHGANEVDRVLFKMREDPRVTRFGKVLRKYSLDELPQLVNVVLGQMSLIGPRPPLPSEVAQYDNDERHRLSVKPGLTGLWQVSGRSDLTWDETVRLDLDYVDNWSLVRDLSIVRRTVRAVFSHQGAY